MTGGSTLSVRDHAIDGFYVYTTLLDSLLHLKHPPSLPAERCTDSVETLEGAARVVIEWLAVGMPIFGDREKVLERDRSEMFCLEELSEFPDRGREASRLISAWFWAWINGR